MKKTSPWLLAYSGGKDSTAVLELVLEAMADTDERHRPVYVLFCDTGVENPLVANFVRCVFRQVRVFSSSRSLPISTHTVSPEKKNHFWVKVIGRGCPPPTNRFRWCTDKLRVNPVRDFCIKHKLGGATTILGVRKGESPQRDRTIGKYVERQNIMRYYDSPKRLYYCPIFEYTVSDVWSCLSNGRVLGKKLHARLARMYGMTNGLEQGVQTFNGNRMGCWVCTVVRRDRSAEELVKQGYVQVKPYLQFRNWLSAFRDNHRYRRKRRRNGSKGPGPLTIKGRKIILARLLKLQQEVGKRLISDSDLALIYSEWERDLHP